MIPRLTGLGGTASFQAKLLSGLKTRGYTVTNDPLAENVLAILVVGGTRHLNILSAAQKRGVLIVQRLDGINWVHRRRFTGFRHFLRAEMNNWLIATIRRHFADRIVYQSTFVKNWWRQQYGDPDKPAFIIHNGVNLEKYSPEGPGRLPEEGYRILLVEGRLGGGYDMGLENAIDLVRQLRNHHKLAVILRVVGEVPERIKRRAARQVDIPIEWQGVLPRESIAEQDRSAHALFSADINAACPNAVIEALACGLPVLGFDTGSLKELVTENAGRITPYGGDEWRLERPDVGTLADATVEILKNNQRFRLGARSLAEHEYDLEEMIDSYCQTWSRI